MTKQELKQAIERATAALDRLEKALDDGDNRKVGAMLYELRHELKIIKQNQTYSTTGDNDDEGI